MRIFFFFILMIVALTMPWWVFVPVAFIYALFYEAYELIILSALVDAFFGNVTFPVFYTLLGGGIFLFVETVKPLLSFYEEPA